MTTTYYLTANASDLSTPTGTNFNNDLDATAPGASNIASANIANGSTITDYGYTVSGVPGADGVTGTYTVEIVNNTAEADLGCTITLHRINSSGTVQQSSSTSAEQSLAADRTFTFSSLDLGTWASGDRLRVDFSFTGNHSHGNRTYDLAIGSTGTRIVCPWTIAGPATKVMIIS